MEWSSEGDKLSAVVPPGALKVIAYFLPSTALGRIQPGQPAYLRLEGFPWTQYGTVTARVTHVASELRDKLLRVELTVDAIATSPIPFQHGLPGTIEVEVDHVSPATLVLRTAGLLLAAPETPHELQDAGRDKRAERLTVDATSGQRRLIVPEVVQISAMDCGPASLKCLLEGYGISVSYGRLREACQTDVDGTSINTMEEVAVQLGLEAEQIMLPVDHLLIAEAQAFPAIVVVRHAGNLTHFIIVWRSHGGFVQVMDPAIGRRWLTAGQLLDELYVHMTPVPATAWREWAGTDEFLGALRRRLTQLGLSRRAGGCLVDAALADPSWHALAALDASTRMVDTLVRAGGLRSGQAGGARARSLFRARPGRGSRRSHDYSTELLVSQTRAPSVGR